MKPLDIDPEDLRLSRDAWRWYHAAPTVVRAFQAGRPLICPIASIVRAIPRASSMLDIGCGAGLVLIASAVSARVKEGLGLDLDPTALDVARQAAKGASLPMSESLAFVSSSSPADWPAGLFDVVTVVDVLHHVPRASQRAFLEHAVMRVREGGLIIVKDMVTAPRWRVATNQLHDLIFARQWISHVETQLATGWIHSLGCRVVNTTTTSRGPYGHYMIVAERPEGAVDSQSYFHA